MIGDIVKRLAARLRKSNQPLQPSGSRVQIQVHHPGDGWQNAGVASGEGKVLVRRMHEALARHGGDRARALDAAGEIVAETGARGVSR